MVCEAFSCAPSQAERELDRDPDLIFAILQQRAYADVYRAFDRAKTAEDQPQGKLADWYRQFMYDLAMERHREREGTHE